MNIVFTPTAWEHYTEWQREDKKMVKRINELIKDIERNGLLKGIGKPEPLKHRKACSRRITEEHRLIYNMDDNRNLILYSCKYHYEDQYLTQDSFVSTNRINKPNAVIWKEKVNF